MLYIADCKPMHDYDLLLAWDWECTKRSAPVFQCSSPEDFPVHSFVIIIASLLSNASKNIRQMWFETWMSDQTFLVLVRFKFSQNIKMLLNTVTLEGAQSHAQFTWKHNQLQFHRRRKSWFSPFWHLRSRLTWLLWYSFPLPTLWL